MSAAPQSSSKLAQASGVKSLKTQRIDVVASLLMSFLVVIGCLVLLMFVLWLTQTFTWDVGEIVIEEERVAGRGDHAEGFERDIEPPGAEEVEELAEPTLEESLQAVTDAATTVAASLEAIDSNSVNTVAGSQRGDSRPPGPLGEGDDIIPRYERWELKFQAKGLRPYATQLDFYQIELGCIGGRNEVDYASNLATSPQRRTGSSAQENKRGRLWFMWRQEGPLKQYDQQLLTQAGVQTGGRQMLKFIPKDLENALAQAEMVYARSKGHNSVKEIAKTIFESQADPGGGYRFVVITQLYRTPRS